jgi:hypothetical protein
MKMRMLIGASAIFVFLTGPAWAVGTLTGSW